MFTKLIVLAVLLATVNAAVSPVAVNPAAINGGDQYSFSYGVNDPSTGDVKDQHEQRVGDRVVGKYSLLESDGTKRIVEYSADSKSGYNAVVRKEGVAVHPQTVSAARSYGNSIPFAGGPINHIARGANPLAYGSYTHPLAHQTPANTLALGMHGNPLLTGARLNLLLPNQYGAHSGLQRSFGGYNPLAFNAHINPLGHYAQQSNPARVSYEIQHPLPYGNYANNFQYAGYNNQYNAGYGNPSYSGHTNTLGHPLGNVARGPTSYANFNLVSLNSYNHGTYAPHNQYGAPLPQQIGLPIPHHTSGNSLSSIRPNW